MSQGGEVIDTQTFREGAELLGWMFGSLFAALWGRSAIKRRWSRDNVVARSDEAEVGIIGWLEGQLKDAESRADRAETRADMAFEQRNAAYLELGSLREKVAALTQQVERQTNHIKTLEGMVTDLQEQVKLLLRSQSLKGD